MLPASSSPIARRTRHAAIGAGLATLAIGAAALAGWFGATPALHTWVPGRGHLSILGALGVTILGGGVALVAAAPGRRWLERLGLVPAALAVALGAAILLPGSIGVELGIGGLFPSADPMGFEPTPPITALGLLLGGLALGLQALGRRRGLLYAQTLAIVLTGIAGIELTAHLYGLDAVLAVSPLTAVSLPEAAALVLLGLGLLFARPEVGVLELVVDPTAGGASVRRLLPITLALMILLGALRVRGEDVGYFPGALGTAIFAVSTAFLIGALIVWNALALRRAERDLRREQEIREERQRQFRHAIVGAPIPILMFAEDGEVLQISRPVEEITGYSAEDLPDVAAWGRLVAGERSGRRALDGLFASLEEPREIVVRTRTGGTRTWRIRTSSLGLLSDGRGSYTAMATDLTEIRRAEERKNEFLAVLGHELRNPLAALTSGLELQSRQEDPARQAELREMMGRQVRHLRRLLDDLLDVSRISRGKIELQKEPLCLAEAVAAVVQEHRNSLEAGASIHFSRPPGPVPVEADPTRLHQILGNLLGNAVKYTPDDGQIWVTVEREPEGAVVRIRDSGAGIAEDQLASIFEPFQQLGREGVRKGGLGLGLTLVRQLATMHDGTVEGASRGPGHGSTFSFRLPTIAESRLSALEPAPSSEAKTTLRETRMPVRVLVVDDNREAADGLAELLSMSGYVTFTAYDGAEALTLEESEMPDAVFLDLQLPDLDGREVAQRIRERRENPPLLVAVSGFGGEDHLVKSKRAGIDHHLVKPIDLDYALEVLRSVERVEQGV